MPPFRPFAVLQHLHYPTSLSLFGLTRSFGYASSPTAQATCTRFLPRQPSPAALRECPTPLVLVRAHGLSSGPEEPDEDEWTGWSAMFAEKGYTAVEIDITGPSSSPGPSSSAGRGSSGQGSPLPSMAKVLAGQIRLMAIPFPPVLISSGVSCLLTQTYIEDNPVSGLVMLNPPPDDPPAALIKGMSFEWPKFKYEPHFPILIMGHSGDMEGLKERLRVARAAGEGVSRGGKGVSLGELKDGLRGDKSRAVSLMSPACVCGH